MNEGYFARSFREIRSTPHWIRKICLLSLVLLIPIFGPIAVMGYITGWARDAAWGVNNPMPAHIFGNEDSHQYSRGFFGLVISFLYSLIPMGLMGAAMLLFALCAASPFIVSDFFHVGILFAAASTTTNILIEIFAALASFAIAILAMVGVMRMAIYTKFSAAFGLRQIIAMAQKDARGLLKIFGLYFGGSVVLSILASISVGIVFVISIPVLIVLMFGAGISNVAGYTVGIIIVILVVAVCVLVAVISVVGTVCLWLMTYRCVGHWICQFDVPAWKGSHDLLPFEVGASHESR